MAQFFVFLFSPRLGFQDSGLGTRGGVAGSARLHDHTCGVEWSAVQWRSGAGRADARTCEEMPDGCVEGVL